MATNEPSISTRLMVNRQLPNNGAENSNGINMSVNHFISKKKKIQWNQVTSQRLSGRNGRLAGRHADVELTAAVQPS